MEQLSLFSYCNADVDKINRTIKPKLREYGIEELYERRFKNKEYTFGKVKEILNNIKHYKKYLEVLYTELSSFAVCKEIDLAEDYKNITCIELCKDCIYIGTSYIVSPIFCLQDFIDIINNKEENNEMYK